MKPLTATCEVYYYTHYMHIWPFYVATTETELVPELVTRSLDYNGT